MDNTKILDAFGWIGDSERVTQRGAVHDNDHNTNTTGFYECAVKDRLNKEFNQT